MWANECTRVSGKKYSHKIELLKRELSNSTSALFLFSFFFIYLFFLFFFNLSRLWHVAWNVNYQSRKVEKNGWEMNYFFATLLCFIRQNRNWWFKENHIMSQKVGSNNRKINYNIHIIIFKAGSKLLFQSGMRSHMVKLTFSASTFDQEK